VKILCKDESGMDLGIIGAPIWRAEDPCTQTNSRLGLTGRVHLPISTPWLATVAAFGAKGSRRKRKQLVGKGEEGSWRGEAKTAKSVLHKNELFLASFLPLQKLSQED